MSGLNFWRGLSTTVEKKISLSHLKPLYKLQSNEVLKPVWFLIRKHLFPNNLEKMNMKRAIQVFSSSVTTGLETMSEVAPHAVTDKDGFNATVHFMEMFRHWFEIHNVSIL